MPIDIFILCVNPSIDIGLINYEISYLHLNGIENIIIFVTDLPIETTTLEREIGMTYYKINDQSYLEYYHNIKKVFSSNYVYNLDEICNGVLSDSIIEILK